MQRFVFYRSILIDFNITRKMGEAWAVLLVLLFGKAKNFRVESIREK